MRSAIHRKFFVLPALLAAAALTSRVDAAPVFHGLGHVRPEHNRSVPIAAGEDGTVVIGESGEAADAEFFVWSAQAGLRPFSDIAGSGGPRRRIVDVSRDGSVIVGTVVDPFAGPTRGFRWSRGGGFQTLGPLNNDLGAATAVTAVSADGRVAVGQSVANGQARGVRWTPQGVLDLGGMSSINPFLHPADVSPDGSKIVGYGNVEGDTNQHAFRWTTERGVERLAEPEGVTISRASAVSADGSVVVGDMFHGSSRLAFRWTASGGMVPLRPAGVARRDMASDVSADGRIIVGSGEGVGGFIWDAGHGVRNLREVLVSEYGLGAQLAGWADLVPMSISGDGRTIVGFATNPAREVEAFRVVLPEPAAWAVAIGFAFTALARRPRRSVRGAA